MAVARFVALALVAIVLAACGGSSGSKDNAFGTEVVVETSDTSKEGPTTQVAITPKAVRTGTMDELSAAGFDVDAKDKGLTPTYLDVHFVNKGANPIAKNLSLSLEDSGGGLISPVVIFNFGDVTFDKCPDRNDHDVDLKPGEQYDTCILFFVDPARKAARIDFLPHVPGKNTDFVYWALPSVTS